MSGPLDVARGLAEAGEAIFVAKPNPNYDPANHDPADPRSNEFIRPNGWQHTKADPSALDQWQPGWAICLVTSGRLAGVDVDTKNGASLEREALRLKEKGVKVLGMVVTPSGGAHFYVAATGHATTNNPTTGIDTRGCTADGDSAGILYLPGTERRKYPGKVYRWRTVPDLGVIDTLNLDEQADAFASYLIEIGSTPRTRKDDLLVPVEGEPLPDVLPGDLADLLGDLGPTWKKSDGSVSEDRSERFHHLVGACRRAGLTQGQTVTALDGWCVGVGKYTNRVSAEVARSWSKVKESAKSQDLTQGQMRTVPLGRKMAAEIMVGRYIFVTNLGWHRWDGTRWANCSEDDMLIVAADWAETWLIGLVKAGTDSAIIKSALRYRDVGVVRQLLAGARTSAELLVAADQLDAHEGLLNCANGVLDLRTGTLLPHDPALLLTKTTGVNYRAGATHPDWAKALTALPDADTVEWVQVHVGAAATGETDRSGPIAFHRGDGENGKTSVIGAIRSAFGDYAILLPDKLLAGRGEEHDTIWMPLRGARLAYMEELPEDHMLPVARIKKLAETPEITARYIGKDNVTWRATHTVIVSTNYTPRVVETDRGTWRRLAMIGYPHTFTGDDKDVTLKKRLKSRAQQEAVLSWIADGARRWYTNGCDLLPLTSSIAAATEEWRDDDDTIGTFLRSELRPTGNYADRITVAELLERFNFGLPVGSRAWSAALFGQRLKAHHLVKSATSGVDRGHRNREPTALTGVAWLSTAQRAQGSSATSELDSLYVDLWDDPAHPVHSGLTSVNGTSA